MDAIDGDRITLQAVAPGESSIEVRAATNIGETSSGSFDLRAVEADEATLDLECSVLDFAEVLFGTDFDSDPVWLTDEIYRAEFELMGEGSLYGYGYYPFSIDPEEAVQISRTDQIDAELITGSQAVDATLEPTLGGETIALPLAHETEEIEIAIVRYEEAESPSAHYSITRPGDEPTLDLVDNRTYNFLPHRFIDERYVCEPEMDADYRATSLTPEVCKFSGSDGPTESIENFALGTLELESAGECTVEVEFLDAPQDLTFSQQWTWTVE